MRATQDMKHQTPLDATDQQLRPLAEYCDRLPSRVPGRRLNRATLWRWALKGRSDSRYLRTVALGSGRFTCDAWVTQFLAEARGPSCAPGAGTLDPAVRERVARKLGASTERRSA